MSQRQPLLEAAGVLNGASYAAGSGGAISPSSWFTLFGAGFTTRSASSSELVSTLEGLSVSITDADGEAKPAQFTFVSPGQLNVLTPDNLQSGAGTLRVSAYSGDVSIPVQIRPVFAGLFSAGATGQGPAAATWLRVHASGTREQGLTFRANAEGRIINTPISLGDQGSQLYLSFFGTGLRRSASASVRIGDVVNPGVCSGGATRVPGVGPSGCRALPRSLVGAGEVAVRFALDGQDANSLTVALN